MSAWRLLYTVACAAGAITCLYFVTAARSVPYSPGIQELSLQVAGQPRIYVLSRPRASGPLPTILFLHGRGGSAERLRWTGFSELGAREGFVTVFPNRISGEWNVFSPAAGQSDLDADTTFIKQLVASLVERGIADPKRIYLGGISNGGIMTLRMACAAPELFAAVGVILASMAEPAGQDCHLSKPMPLLMINGTADTVVPYAGGKTAAGLQIWGTDRTVAFFRQLDGCTGAPERTEMQKSAWSDAPPIVVSRWSDCSGAPVVLYSVIGGGHDAPGGPGSRGAFKVSQTFWNFFRDKTASNN